MSPVQRDIQRLRAMELAATVMAELERSDDYSRPAIRDAIVAVAEAAFRRYAPE